MKYDAIPSTLFTQNRKRLIQHLLPNSMVVLHSSDEFPRSGDQNFTFKQNPDLFCASGIDQEESILLLFPDCADAKYREVLFLKKTNEHIAIWEGHKYTKEEAHKASGISIESIFWLESFDTIFPMLMHWTDNVYLNTNENDRYVHQVPYRDVRKAKELRAQFPLHHYHRLAPIMRKLRPVKLAEEVALIQQACNITEKAFRRVLAFVKPGVAEYEIEAEIIHEFIRNKGTGHAYNPIIASGHNACILHYNDNNQVCKDGDVILFDFGAEYGNYNADLSRAIPVNGKFTPRQKAVYNAVLKVMKEAKQMLVVGAHWDKYHAEVGKVMESELIGLGLLDKHDVAKQDPKMPLYKRYFMHGTSHHLGIDVHDFAYRHQLFEAGNVLTCEPGIYIPEENLGIRLENDILITKDGNIDLMKNIPIEADEIEALMNA
jgi:Xaa-Pro aminopeptidase